MLIRCTTCHAELDEVKFAPNPSRKSGLSNECRGCRSRRKKSWRKKGTAEGHCTVEKCLTVPEPGHKICLVHRDENRDRHRRIYAKTYMYASKLRRDYGMTLEQYDAMLSNQNGCCAICGNFGNGTMRMAVDHCHVTGRVRGLLCNSCNGFLGRIKDDVSKVVDYMVKYGGDS